jgi:hypothetical protein
MIQEMPKRTILKIYWNPIVFSLATALMYLLVLRQLQDSLSVPKLMVDVLDFAYPVIVYGLLLWFLMHFIVSWPVAVIQFVYGIVKFKSSHSKKYLHNCLSSLVVFVIYIVVIALAKMGFMLDV